MAHRLVRSAVQKLLRSKVAEVVNEPEYDWQGGFRSYMVDAKGEPVVRVGVANFSPDTDIWEGLRTPAHVGMYPLTPEDIWHHYACMNVKTTRFDGSPNPLAMPETYEEARARFKRVVLISGFLATEPKVYETYAKKIERNDADPYDYYNRAAGDVSAIINKAVGKVALSLMGSGRAVVPMTDRNTGTIVDRTRSEYLKGRYHGPCNSHWPASSAAALTRLLRFGLNRLPFRDEVTEDGKRVRLFGRSRSIVVFDEREPSGRDGEVVLLDSERLKQLRQISDYTVVTPEVAAQRYCPYNRTNKKGASVCGKCLQVCPSQALQNSSPLPNGVFPKEIARQKHRFWNGTVDFDFGNCTRERGQKAQLYDDYVCARCEAICAAKGIRRSVSDLKRIAA